jgi:hypoxanthine phosphoribosyltransferase
MVYTEKNIQIKDLEFSPFITRFDIQERIAELAIKINQDYENRNPIFISVLSGSFMFTSDLLKQIDIQSEVTFIKVNSYEGTSSTNQIKEMIGLSNNITDRHVIIIEDIVDTGHTMNYLTQELSKKDPSSIEIVTLFYKPEAHKYNTKLRYVGFEIPKLFIVGYGLDYDGLGRNYQDVYQLVS